MFTLWKVNIYYVYRHFLLSKSKMFVIHILLYIEVSVCVLWIKRHEVKHNETWGNIELKGVFSLARRKLFYWMTVTDEIITFTKQSYYLNKPIYTTVVVLSPFFMFICNSDYYCLRYVVQRYCRYLQRTISDPHFIKTFRAVYLFKYKQFSSLLGDRFSRNHLVHRYWSVWYVFCEFDGNRSNSSPSSAFYTDKCSERHFVINFLEIEWPQNRYVPLKSQLRFIYDQYTFWTI